MSARGPYCRERKRKGVVKERFPDLEYDAELLEEIERRARAANLSRSRFIETVLKIHCIMRGVSLGTPS